MLEDLTLVWINVSYVNRAKDGDRKIYPCLWKEIWFGKIGIRKNWIFKLSYFHTIWEFEILYLGIVGCEQVIL